MLKWCFDLVGFFCLVDLVSNVEFSWHRLIWIRVNIVEVFFASIEGPKVLNTHLLLMSIHCLCFAVSAMKSKIDQPLTATACNGLPLPSHPPNGFVKCNPSVTDSTRLKLVTLLLSINLCRVPWARHQSLLPSYRIFFGLVRM